MIIAIDVGGTTTRIAVSFSGKTLDKQIKFPTVVNYEDACSKMVEIIYSLIDKKKIKRIVIGVPGVLDAEKKSISLAPNLQGWQKKTLADDFMKEFSTEVYLENDTDLGGLGEATFGKSSGYGIVAYCGIGTGFGGTRIVNGFIDVSAQGFEVGHMIVNPNGDLLHGCGQSGCLESYVSGIALKKRYGYDRIKLCNDDKILDEIVRYFAIGLVNITVLWSPDCIVLGGGFIQAGSKILAPTKKYFKEYLKVFKSPRIMISSLKGDANLYGCLAYKKEKSFRSILLK